MVDGRLICSHLRSALVRVADARQYITLFRSTQLTSRTLDALTGAARRRIISDAIYHQCRAISPHPAASLGDDDMSREGLFLRLLTSDSLQKSSYSGAPFHTIQDACIRLLEPIASLLLCTADSALTENAFTTEVRYLTVVSRK